MANKDGGSAFPYNVQTSWAARAQAFSVGMNVPDVSTVSGMSLRDYFAAKAMPMVADVFYRTHTQLTDGTVPNLAAKMAYEFADAMLKERNA